MYSQNIKLNKKTFKLNLIQVFEILKEIVEQINLKELNEEFEKNKILHNSDLNEESLWFKILNMYFKNLDYEFKIIFKNQNKIEFSNFVITKIKD